MSSSTWLLFVVFFSCFFCKYYVLIVVMFVLVLVFPNAVFFVALKFLLMFSWWLVKASLDIHCLHVLGTSIFVFCFSSDFFCSMSFINFQDHCMAFEFLPTYVLSCRNVPCACFLAPMLLW